MTDSSVFLIAVIALKCSCCCIDSWRVVLLKRARKYFHKPSSLRLYQHPLPQVHKFVELNRKEQKPIHYIQNVLKHKLLLALDLKQETEGNNPEASITFALHAGKRQDNSPQCDLDGRLSEDRASEVSRKPGHLKICAWKLQEGFNSCLLHSMSTKCN